MIEAGGAVKARATTEYPILTPRPGWAEQNPEDWWHATKISIKAVLEKSAIDPKDIAGIGLTGQMHGLVLLDENCFVIRPCIMWNDQRSALQCAEIANRVGAEQLITITGKPALPNFTAGKILWVRENEPDIFSRVAQVLLPKDYIRYCLTGGLFMDVADASGTNLFDVGKRKWSKDVFDLLGIPHHWLPEVVESSIICSRVYARAAADTGLKEGTPVVGGAGDQAAQAIGTGIARPGIVSVTIGTSGVVFAATSNYVYDRAGLLHAYCHAAPDMWHLMGVMLSAGGSFRWFRDALGDVEKESAKMTGVDPYDILADEAEKVTAGSDGLIFLPYLSGERTPHPDPFAKGVFFGLTLRHTKAHLIRAVMEGVTYGLRDGLELLHGLGLSFDRVRVSGGGARSRLWRQMLADIFNLAIVEVNATEGAAYGAALLAGVGAGIYQDVSGACNQTIREIATTRPGPTISLYEEYYQRYRALYPILKEEFKKISSIAEKRYG